MGDIFMETFISFLVIRRAADEADGLEDLICFPPGGAPLIPGARRAKCDLRKASSVAGCPQREGGLISLIFSPGKAR